MQDDTDDWIVEDTKAFLLVAKQDSPEQEWAIRNAIARARAAERKTLRRGSDPDGALDYKALESGSY